MKSLATRPITLKSQIYDIILTFMVSYMKARDTNYDIICCTSYMISHISSQFCDFIFKFYDSNYVFVLSHLLWYHKLWYHTVAFWTVIVGLESYMISYSLMFQMLNGLTLARATSRRGSASGTARPGIWGPGQDRRTDRCSSAIAATGPGPRGHSNLGGGGWKTLSVGHCISSILDIQGKTMAKPFCRFSSEAMQ